MQIIIFRLQNKNKKLYSKCKGVLYEKSISIYNNNNVYINTK